MQLDVQGSSYKSFLLHRGFRVPETIACEEAHAAYVATDRESSDPITPSHRLPELSIHYAVGGAYVPIGYESICQHPYHVHRLNSPLLAPSIIA